MSAVQFEVVLVVHESANDIERKPLGVYVSAAEAIYQAFFAARQIGGAQYGTPAAVSGANDIFGNEIAIIHTYTGYICVNELSGE